MGFVTAFFAPEGQSIAIISADVVASWAGLRGMSRIDVDHSNSSFIGFILDEGLELPESPAGMLISELFGYVCSFPYNAI